MQKHILYENVLKWERFVKKYKGEPGNLAIEVEVIYEFYEKNFTKTCKRIV